MNKFLLSMVAATFVLVAFSGCAKNSEDSGEETAVGGLDEALSYDSAVADNGFQVTGNITGPGTALTAGTDGSATSVKVVDVSPDDATGATDLADFLLDAKEADGGRVQAEVRSLTTATDLGVDGDFLGGAAHNVDVFGDSGIGPADLPKAKAYILLQGLARVKSDGQTIDELQLVQVAVTKGIRGADAVLLSAVEDDLEIHVLFPGSLLEGNEAVPGSADGFLYYYFENVKLDVLPADGNASVGSRLSAAPKPNVPPTAAAVVMLNNTTVTSADFDPAQQWLNVTLDASNSTDTDGSIEAYSWDVREYNATGVLVPANKTSGAVAPFSFTSPGKKLISLRIIDEDGGIANTTIEFFVNFKKTYTHDFAECGGEAACPAMAGAGPDCLQPHNCNAHSVTVQYGAAGLTSTELSADGPVACEGGSISLLAPDKTEIASGSSLSATQDKLTQVGKYEMVVTFTAQVACTYTFDLMVTYGPATAEAEA